MRSIGAAFYDRMPFLAHTWDTISNSSKYNIIDGTQLIQLYKFVCIIPTQNSNALNHPLVASSDIPG